MALTSSAWDLKPGDKLNRDERMVRFGGGRQGGIEPSARTPNVFVYSDPKAGATFGYHYDGWNADGTVFLYTGEGGSGEQQLTSGNKANAGTPSGCSSRTGPNRAQERGDSSTSANSGSTLSCPTSVLRPGVDGLMRSVLVFRLRELRPVGWDDKQPLFRPIRHAWRVEVAHGRLGRSRRLAKSFENTTTSATGWLQVACIATTLRHLSLAQALRRALPAAT